MKFSRVLVCIFILILFSSCSGAGTTIDTNETPASAENFVSSNAQNTHEVTDPAFSASYGKSYVSQSCLYMSPLSSTFSGNDNGLRLTVFDDKGYILDHRQTTVTDLGEFSPVWIDFPYTSEQWSKMFFGVNSSIYEEDWLYRPLSTDLWLIDADPLLLMVRFGGGIDDRFIWSIYSLVEEDELGYAQWTFESHKSSAFPNFRFEFDFDFKEISAACMDSKLSDGGSQEDYAIILKDSNVLYWSPLSGEETSPFLTSSEISLIISFEDRSPVHGTIYITDNGSGEFTFTARPVLGHVIMTQNEEYGGATLSIE